MVFPRTLKDALRIIVLLVVASLMLWFSTYRLPDPALGPVLTSSSILLYIVAFSHFTRRVVLPSINTQKLLSEVYNGNMAAAVVLVGMFYVFVQLVMAGVALMR